MPDAVLELIEKYSQNKDALASALKSAQNKTLLHYNWRNRFLLIGIGVLLLAKVASAYV